MFHPRAITAILATGLVGLGALWLAGCSASLPPSAELPIDEEQLAIRAAIDAWAEAGLPWTHECRQQYDRIRVVVSRPAEFTELCGRKPLHAGGRLYACNTEQYEQAFPFWMVDDRRVPLLVISELQPELHRRLLVVHETMHWLERCSGKGIDFDHSDPTVWHEARVAAQQEVIAALRDRGRPRDMLTYRFDSHGKLKQRREVDGLR
ncbi:MAG: hypothetical protein OEZ06_07660 [Myxococcales bacterium]|nr:hypothetical protein [Myxococcales bacterium]